MNHPERVVLVVGALPSSLINFRKDLLVALVDAGYRVIAFADRSSPTIEAELAQLGVAFCPYPVSRSGLNPIRDLGTLLSLVKAFRRTRPFAVIAYTVKPVIYCGIASRLFPGAKYVPMITGLGYAMTRGGWRRNLLVSIVKQMYRTALKGSHRVVFQNPDNLSEFAKTGIASRSNAVLVSGSGVDLKFFKLESMPPRPITFLMIARLLKDKGVLEFCSAAEVVRREFQNVRFVLAGPLDPSPNAVKLEDLERYFFEGVVEYIGELTDVRAALASCHAFVLPSYHEGRPRTVQEALATGRFVVTTDAPGCRDSVEDGVTGTIVPARDGDALASRLSRLVVTADSWANKPEIYREYAESRYDSEAISRQVVALIGV